MRNTRKNSADQGGGTRALVYLRVSGPKQAHTDELDPEGISLPAQRKACLRKAEQMGLEVAEEYVEPGISGPEMARRPEFQRMLARIKADPAITHVVVHKLSRLSRNCSDEALAMSWLADYGVRLVSATEPVDDSPEGQLTRGILGAMAQFRSQQGGGDVV